MYQARSFGRRGPRGLELAVGTELWPRLAISLSGGGEELASCKPTRSRRLSNRPGDLAPRSCTAFPSPCFLGAKPPQIETKVSKLNNFFYIYIHIHTLEII